MFIHDANKFNKFVSNKALMVPLSVRHI